MLTCPFELNMAKARRVNGSNTATFPTHNPWRFEFKLRFSTDILFV
jgi:hypothetical protein